MYMERNADVYKRQLYEIIESHTDTVAIRDVDIIDLLGRDEIKLNVEEISDYLKGKSVLVTGGGGSIGSELCRQIALFEPKRLVIFDIYENNAYDLQNELLRRFPNLNLEVLIGSVRDKARVERLFEICRPDVVFLSLIHISVDEDLASLEDEVYGSEDDDEEECYYEVTCPSCNETVCLSESIIEDGQIECPNCGELLEFDLDDVDDGCGCGCDCGHDDE